MKEMGIKIDTAKNEPFTGHQRRHINQHRMGTISDLTWMDMLRHIHITFFTKFPMVLDCSSSFRFLNGVEF
jgi:hypothetical protein